MVRSSINVGRFHSVLLSVSFQAHGNVSVSFFPPSSPFLSPLFSPEKMDGRLVRAFPMWRNRNTNTYRSNNRTCQPRFCWRQSEILVRLNKCPSPLDGLVGKLAWWLKWKSFFQTSMRISVVASSIPVHNHRLGQEVKYTCWVLAEWCFLGHMVRLNIGITPLFCFSEYNISEPWLLSLSSNKPLKKTLNTLLNLDFFSLCRKSGLNSMLKHLKWVIITWVGERVFSWIMCPVEVCFMSSCVLWRFPNDFLDQKVLFDVHLHLSSQSCIWSIKHPTSCEWLLLVGPRYPNTYEGLDTTFCLAPDATWGKF